MKDETSFLLEKSIGEGEVKGMTKTRIAYEEKANTHRSRRKDQTKHQLANPSWNLYGLTNLQQQIGNRAVQRLLTQRSSGAFDLDDDTAARINRERDGGQPLDGKIQAQMNDAMGHDFGGVRVHTSSESNDLNQRLNAKAFTTGQDIFFRDGAYEPHTSGGQELVAHELAHVVQQSSGAVGSGGQMKVNAPGDAFEQEADAVAKAVTGPGAQEAIEEKELE